MRRSLALASIALLLIAAVMPAVPVAVVVELITFVRTDVLVARVAPATHCAAQPVALLSLALFRAPPASR